MSNDSGKVSIGVGLMPLVVSVREAKVGEKISLKLIEGLTPSGIIWRSGSIDVPVLDDSSVIFEKTGVYIPVILGHPQHISYSITIS